MDGETNNLLAGGTDNADLSSIDNPANWSFADSDDDQNTRQTQPEAETAEGTDEGATDQPETESEDEAQESENADADETTDDEGEETPEVKDDVLVTLRDGAQVPLSELKQGYLRQSDFTRKSQEVASKRSELDALTARVTQTVEVFTDFIAKSLPNEPDLVLATTNPAQYIAQKAQYDAAMTKVQELLDLGTKSKEVKSTLDADTQKNRLAEESQKLVEAMPMTANEKGRADFFKQVMEGATSVGFSEAELKSVSDHRLLVLGYWAKKGMAAEKAKETVKQKVANVPPVAPVKRQKTGADKAIKNREAMQKLSRTGSIQDALSIDFD